MRNGFRSRRKHRAALWALAVTIMAVPGMTRAQLSPGPLHRSHAFLEGMENCTKCHGSDRRAVTDRCLECHTLIAERRRSVRGPHGRPEFAQCQMCHVEHQGRDFALIYWKEGEASFDHTQTGYRLEGKHATVTCRKCHQTDNIPETAVLPPEQVNRSSTYLGLDRACTSCHQDEHRGQFSGDCTKCHSLAGWRPAPGFDHDKTKYPLTGRHSTAACDRCHGRVSDARDVTNTYLRFAVVKHAQCTDCHKDPHAGKLGGQCQSCHTTSGWELTGGSTFDHSKTRYPLVGRHAQTPCEKCHVPGRPRTAIQFAACRDCHNDFHAGVFVERAQKGACEDCHTVNGFTPSTFTADQHDATEYPLRGAHRAVPCIVCHVTTPLDAAPRKYTFRMLSFWCTDCHKDPHGGQVNALVEKYGCETCHEVESWRRMRFDHELTRFALDGRHAEVSCRPCHAPTPDAGTVAVLKFGGVGTRCVACHKEPHRGQFAESATTATDCRRCHTTVGWKRLIFDHDRDSRFRLEGAHARVPCEKCHLAQMDDAGRFVSYKPLDVRCASCHAQDPAINEQVKP